MSFHLKPRQAVLDILAIEYLPRFDLPRLDIETFSALAWAPVKQMIETEMSITVLQNKEEQT